MLYGGGCAQSHCSELVALSVVKLYMHKRSREAELVATFELDWPKGSIIQCTKTLTETKLQLRLT